MKVDSRTAPVAMHSPTGEPTPASTWRALAGKALTDELLEWPADVFALTNVILNHTEAYRFVLSPPGSVEWPPSRFDSWSDTVESVGRQWSVWLEDRKSGFPGLLAEEWRVFR
jgi:hypothetical protein